jgi:hypothetical protein
MKRRTVRQLAWVGVALCVVGLTLGVTVLGVDQLPGVTEGNVRRIKPGMTLAEVEGFLGGPPNGGTTDHALAPGGLDKRLGYRWERVWWDRGVVSIRFTEDGRVTAVREYGWPQADPLDPLRSLFGLHPMTRSTP